MTPQDLDKSYTTLCNALNDVSEVNSQQFLAMLSLSLMARAESADEVLTLIEYARTQCSNS